MSDTLFFHTDEEIAEIVRRLESCDFGKGEFTHAMHLAAAAWFLSRYSPEEALNRMRSALIRLTEKFQVKAYHETLTSFWLRLVLSSMISSGSACSLTDSINRLISQFGNKETVYEYYSRAVLMCDQARQNWVEPDLKLLPCPESR